MRFWDKLRSKFGPDAGNNERIRIAKEGERLEAVVEGGAFDVLLELILDPMEKEAFEAFKKIDPANQLEVIQTQKLAQIVSEVKRRVENKIQAGLLARQQLINDSTQEGE